jgi:ribokinase
VVDTTAAGDSFSGAIAVAISNGKGIDESVNFGNIVGALTVTKKGAQNSLPTLNAVKSFIENGGT